MIDKTDPTNRDTVPAMLTPGEFVLNKEATQMFGPVVEQMNNAGLQHRAMKNMGGGIPAYNKGGDVKPSLQQGIKEAAAALGIDPVDLATIISYETAGTLSPTQKGPTTKWGQHRGYIQFGEPQAKEYGVDFSSKDSAMSSQLGANGAIVKYFKAHGFEPGMGLMDLYSIVNTGGPGRYNWSDEKAGGAKGTVSDKVIKQMPAHRDKAIKLLDIDFAPETSIRPQARGEVPTQAVPEFIAQMGPQTVEQVSVPPVQPQMRPTPQVEPLAIEQAVMQASVPQVQAVPPSPSSFGEAFKDARADMGAGGIFTFRGNDYTTNYAEEEDKRMTANMGGAVHLNSGGMSIDRMARRKLQEDVDNAWFKRNARDALTKFDQAQLAIKNRPQRFAAPSPMQTDIDVLPMALPSGSSQQEPGMPDLGSPRRVPPMSPPMPDVNSDESLLQGSSSSVEQAFKSGPFTNVPRYNPDSLQAAVERGQGNYVSAPTVPEVRDPRKLGGAEGYGQTGDATSRRAAEQQRLIALRENLTPGSPEHIKVSNLITGSFTPSMTSLDQLVDYNIPASMQDASRMMANNVPMEMANVPPTAAKIPLMKEDIVQAQQVLNPYDFNPYGDDPMGEIPKVENSDGYTNEELRVLSNTDNAEGSPWAEILQERTERQASELRSKLQKDADNGVVPTQSSLNQLSDLERQSRNASEVKAVNDKVVAANQQSVTTTKDALGATERERKLRAIERAAEYGITVNDDPSGSSEKVTPKKVAGIINNLPEGANTSPDQDRKAKEAAAAEEARLNQAGNGDVKKTPEVSGAMSMLKSVFGDLFDSKELVRAAIMYLGGRATGMDGNQALAFAGKNYIARTDAKTSFYNEQATSGKWTNGSLAKFKKTRDPSHLIPIGAVYRATGVAPQAYYDKVTGNMVMFEQHQIGKDGSKIWTQAGRDPRDSKYRLDHSRMTQDTFNVKSTDAYIARWDKAENDFADIINAELLKYEIPADGDRAKSNSLKDINATTDAKAVSAFAQKYDIAPDAMALVIRNAMRKAGDDVQFSRIDEVNDLTPYLKESYITTHTGDKSNFMIGNGKTGEAYSEKLVSSEEFSSWLGQTQRTMIDLLPDANLDQYNPVQFSQKLMQLPIYKEWMSEDEEVRSDLASQGSPNRSGFMEYISENLAKGVVNS